MPRVCIETPELEDSISRPVTIQVIRQMAERVGIPPDTSVRFLGGALALIPPGGSLDDRAALNRLPADQRITIDASEEFDENYALSTPVLRPDQLVFFDDQDLDVYMKPVYQRVNVTVSVSLTGTDKTAVNTWLATLKRRFSRGVAENLHVVDYHYPIPNEFMVRLAEFHRMREETEGLNETMGAWLRRCFSPKMSVMYNQAGNNPTFIIRETQVKVLGWFDFNAQPPKPERENDVGAWTAGFTYTFCYDRCETVVMSYPLMIHNQVIRPDFYIDVKAEEVEDVIAQAGLSTTLFNAYSYEARGSKAFHATEGIPIPHFDDWLPKDRLPGTINLTRLMLQTNPDSRREIICLDNLGDWAFAPMAIDYMRQRPAKLLRPYESAFYVALHRKNAMVPPGQLIVTPELNVYSVSDLSLRDPYHLSVWLVTDLGKLSMEDQLFLCKYGILAVTILLMVDPTLSSTTTTIQLFNDTRPTSRIETQDPSISNPPGGFTPPIPGKSPPDLFDNPYFVKWLERECGLPPVKTREIPVLPPIQPDGSIRYKDFAACVDYIRVNRYLERGTVMHKWRTVGQIMISPHRR